MGVRQHPACPREVLYPGLSPVWAPRMKEQEAQKGQAGEDWGTDGAGLRTQGLALRGEVELAPNARRGLAVSVWAELTATAVPTGSPWGEGGWGRASLVCPGHSSQHQGQVVLGEGKRPEPRSSQTLQMHLHLQPQITKSYSRLSTAHHRQRLPIPSLSLPWAKVTQQSC